MTDRIKTLTVHLDQDLRSDDCQPLIDAIYQLRHVEKVDMQMVTVADYEARVRAVHLIKDDILNVLKKNYGD